MYSLTWLADVLRTAGLKVVEQPGWQNRGQGDFGPARGVLIHHTGSNPKGGAAPDIGIVTNGRADPPLSGPLCHILLGRDSVCYLIAAGHANHAGPGSWHGVTRGNSELIGIEAENNGADEPWPPAQISVLLRASFAILRHIGADPVMCAGHKEYALPRGRKVDPDFDMVAFRGHLDTMMSGAAVPLDVPHTDPERAMLRKGDMGESVKVLQAALGLTGDDIDGNFGPKTDGLVRTFQAAHGLKDDGLVGPATWKALGH